MGVTLPESGHKPGASTLAASGKGSGPIFLILVFMILILNFVAALVLVSLAVVLAHDPVGSSVHENRASFRAAAELSLLTALCATFRFLTHVCVSERVFLLQEKEYRLLCAHLRAKDRVPGLETC